MDKEPTPEEYSEIGNRINHDEYADLTTFELTRWLQQRAGNSVEAREKVKFELQRRMNIEILKQMSDSSKWQMIMAILTGLMAVATFVLAYAAFRSPP